MHGNLRTLILPDDSLTPRYEIRKLYMQICTFASIWACMKACLDMHPCMVCGSVYLYAHDTRVFSKLQLCVCVCAHVCLGHCMAISKLSLSRSLRHSLSWTPSQTGRRKESDLTPDCAFREEGLEACQLHSGSTSPLCPSYFFPSARPKL